MRTSLSRMRSICPVLSLPSNSRWFRSHEITATRARRWSSSCDQPAPNAIGAWNIGKKSDVVDSMVAMLGGSLLLAADSLTLLSTTNALRSAGPSRHRSTAEV
ncbi:hypothetical protein D3C81_705370 [compost metagenome]